MRKSRFSDEQVVAILREADRDQIAAVAKRHGVSEQTIYTWRKRFGTFQADDVRRLKQLEAENARGKKLVAERDLEIEVMKEITAKKMVSVPARRTQVTFATGRGLSQRRACTLLSVARSALRYRSRKAEKDAPVLARMRELAARYPRLTATGASGSFSAVTVTGWASAAPIDCGRQRSCRCRGGDRESVSPAAGHVPRRRREQTRCGATTSCSTGVPTGRSSSA
jgi:putative transposase